MRLTVVGCGDAFGSGGRAQTCFLLENAGETLAVDFGATSLPALKRLGIAPERLDAVVLSHLHGDHFGGIPFLLLDQHFVARRERPLTIVGPVGTQERIGAALAAFFPGAPGGAWRFPLTIVDLPCGQPQRLGGLALCTTEVEHPSGAPSTALRLAGRERTFAYSGDTRWTEALVGVAQGADLYVTECYTFDTAAPYHLDFRTIDANRDRLGARRIMLTHMSDDALAHLPEMQAKGYVTAHDGLVLDL
jgi:ribonuclease BN (tRNA processing enzyme)